MDGESANLRKRQDESSDSRLRRNSMTVGLSSLRTLERETGFEPATSTLARLHSTTELLPHRKLLFILCPRDLSTVRGSEISNVASQAPAPAKSLLREISAPQSYARGAAGFRDDRRYVVSVRLLRNVCDSAIDAGRPDDLTLFANVHGGLRLSDLVARTGFDFDEGQRERLRRFIVGDDVNLARDLAAVSSVTDRGDEISRDYPVALPLEILRDQPLAVFSQGQMRRTRLLLAKLSE